MELREFVTTALSDLLHGIRDAQATPEIGALVSPQSVRGVIVPIDSGVVQQPEGYTTVIKFDVAVTAETTDSAKGGGGIKIAVMNVGAEGQVASRNATVSRIQFSVPIVLPPNSQKPPLPKREEPPPPPARPVDRIR